MHPWKNWHGWTIACCALSGAIYGFVTTPESLAIRKCGNERRIVFGGLRRGSVRSRSFRLLPFRRTVLPDSRQPIRIRRLRRAPPDRFDRSNVASSWISSV